MIVNAWKETLGVTEIGLDENVFDLGATSLMMPQVQMDLQRELGREIPLVDSVRISYRERPRHSSRGNYGSTARYLIAHSVAWLRGGRKGPE